jgi:hypothetical protein
MHFRDFAVPNPSRAHTCAKLVNGLLQGFDVVSVATLRSAAQHCPSIVQLPRVPLHLLFGNMSAVEQDCCWICLDGPEPGRELQRPCKCPRVSHADCLARWQLQSGGKR